MYLFVFRFLKSVKYFIKNKTIQVGYYYYLHSKIYRYQTCRVENNNYFTYQGQYKINNYDNIILLYLIIGSYYLY